MTREQLQQIGRNHADEALDQMQGFSGVEGRTIVIDSYRTNLYDTLIEMGLGNDADAVNTAEYAFEQRLEQRSAR